MEQTKCTISNETKGVGRKEDLYNKDFYRKEKS